tara:strand:- start:1553 stop:2638 length:1086 start_codon:yes stop_codon:yes gene_type:complete
MKKTTLYNTHLELNAKMTSFGGYEMPVQYSGVSKEHLAVRSSIGAFDVSHMGEFYVSGNKSLALLQYVCSNDISKVIIGKAQYNYFPNLIGGVVDDLIVYRLEEELYLLVVNASNIEKDWEWLKEQNKNFGATLENKSEEIALLAIQGPFALKAMQQLTKISLESLPFYAHSTDTFAGIENTLVATTGYTGAGGIEIYFPAKEAPKVWKAIMEAGKHYNIIPVGLAARDTLRLEMGYCLYGNEINETSSPIAAGLGWVTKPETNPINGKYLAEQKKNGTPIKLVGFEMNERGIPRSGYSIIDSEGIIIGKVTSGTQSPLLKKGIGLGYISKQFSSAGSNIGILIREKKCAAKVINLPFIRT